MKKIFDTNTWVKLGQPDLNSKMYFVRDKKKVWGIVTQIHYGHRKGVMLKITPFKKNKKNKNPIVIS